MIQKATWIIPGILVTLLLGLLWAMPAFAADAGSIDFLDSDDDEISYLSLNGLGGPGQAIMIQVSDEDLNEPDTEFITADTNEDTGFNSKDWANLADSNDDGNLNYQDFKWFVVEAGSETAVPPTKDKRHYADTVARQLNLNVQSGTLGFVSPGGVPAPSITYTSRAGVEVENVGAVNLEFEIFNQEDISEGPPPPRSGVNLRPIFRTMV